MWKVYIVKFIHMVIVLINIAAVPVLLITQSIFISVPLITVIVGLSTNETHFCVLTRLENYYRRKVGLPPIRMFIEDIVAKIKGK